MSVPGMKTKNLDPNFIFFLTYFFITFYGGISLIEEYLFVDDLPIVYSMILGLVSGLISSTLIYFLKPRKLSVKIIAGIILFGFIVLLNILVN
jgi:hypothetical protein